MIDPIVSKYFSDLAKKRKRPYLGFKDTAKAKQAAEKSAKVRKANKNVEDLRDP